MLVLIGIVLYFAIDVVGAEEAALFGLIPAAVGVANLVYAAIQWEQGKTRKSRNRPVRRAQSRSVDERGAHVVGHRRDLVLVVRVVDADGERGATLELRRHLGAQLEAQEVHGRGLDLVLALQVLVGDREHALEARHLHPAAIFDAAQFFELHPADLRRPGTR